ncbi:wax ester/triacylglycerol synthase family O-acyltransferase [Mycolicibacterium sp. 120270]|uniref:WS/DGAT/MGAT family O-acyltransferase n=1 Tax=Mycolicibacterium sp. 120270 TaxID=3090600 RepID=UPI00299DED05|nr:wax ester/triacylglycerol synthase family O-acyltransferase [Mycolicibacterium sp. 120270]MDX1886001.1 wax ester/triacylglycerol synthase family O-acyltransferase [Mycolicibacterium sp. 120270]
MEHLNTLDAGFLEAEDSDRHISLAVGGLSIIEGSVPDSQALLAGIAERIEKLPRSKQVLRTHALDLNPPEWVEDETFDIAHHIHRAALPQPGDDKTLFRFTAEVMERRLDRDRPLWECWIIEGLENGRWALLMKIHHCIADGIATMHMFSGLSDEGGGANYANEIRAAKEKHDDSTGRKLNLNPLSWVGTVRNLTATATSTALLAFEGAIEVAGGLLSPGAQSSLIGPVSSMRRISCARVDLADVNKICEAFDVTLNDVALAAITDSFRAALVRRGEQPRRNSLRTLVPVSIRSPDAVGITDNRVSLMLPFLPVDKEDPEEQLRTVHRRLTRAKSSGQREAGSVALAAANIVPFPFTAWAIRALTKLPQRGVVTLATNVPGPRKRLRVMGREVVQVVPIPPIALQLRTGIAILSYADELVFGITGDFDTAWDVDDLAKGIEAAVARLVASATRNDEHRGG